MAGICLVRTVFLLALIGTIAASFQMSPRKIRRKDYDQSGNKDSKEKSTPQRLKSSGVENFDESSAPKLYRETKDRPGNTEDSEEDASAQRSLGRFKGWSGKTKDLKKTGQHFDESSASKLYRKNKDRSGNTEDSEEDASAQSSLGRYKGWSGKTKVLKKTRQHKSYFDEAEISQTIKPMKTYQQKSHFKETEIGHATQWTLKKTNPQTKSLGRDKDQPDNTEDQ